MHHSDTSSSLPAAITTEKVNTFLLSNNLRICSNPSVSPDFCLDWKSLQAKLLSSKDVHLWPKSSFKTKEGDWNLLEDLTTGDCAWRCRLSAGTAGATLLSDGVALSDGGAWAYPATFSNLLLLKNIIQSSDPESTIFPSAQGSLSTQSLGIGARFTTLHWPAVEWAMSTLGLSVTANQNSIPRELVYDVNEMLANNLDSVPFPFIGTNVPEGHQGQSVEGMSHGCIVSKVRNGFHHRRIPWSFNADHQPIGGKFDAREARLVAGCVLASYITFDLSPELAQTATPTNPSAWVSEHVPSSLITKVKSRLAQLELKLGDTEFNSLLAYVWPALKKMKQRDSFYRAIREHHFSTEIGREYLRELSIDELPGITTQETTAAILALCEALDMRIHFVAPAFGFQKNMPYPDNAALRDLILKQWKICKAFNASIGFHSGSGKSAENYQVMGEITGGNLEIKTSGRYTYEMGRALFQSKDPRDQKLWADWYQFTVDMAVNGAFSPDATEQKMARSFIDAALGPSATSTTFNSAANCRAAIDKLPPSPEHMFWFEYNFLYVLAGGGSASKSALGDHSIAGYQQRARFYSISNEAKLNFSRNIASYIIFLAENTGLASKSRCAEALKKLSGYQTLEQFVDAIG